MPGNDAAPVLAIARSHFSANGIEPVEAVVAAAERAGARALLLTDLENLHGQVRFHEAARAVGLVPITGVEWREGFDGRTEIGHRGGRLFLVALDEHGF